MIIHWTAFCEHPCQPLVTKAYSPVTLSATVFITVIVRPLLQTLAAHSTWMANGRLLQPCPLEINIAIKQSVRTAIPQIHERSLKMRVKKSFSHPHFLPTSFTYVILNNGEPWYQNKTSQYTCYSAASWILSVWCLCIVSQIRQVHSEPAYLSLFVRTWKNEFEIYGWVYLLMALLHFLLIGMTIYQWLPSAPKGMSQGFTLQTSSFTNWLSHHYCS